MATFFLNSGIQHLLVDKQDSDLTSLGLDAAAFARAFGSRWHFSNQPFVRVFSQRRQTTTSFVLAIDTREGPTAEGFVGSHEDLFSDPHRQAFGITFPLLNSAFRVKEIEICTIDFAHDAPLEVALVLDMGNTRTSGLIIEDDEPDNPIGPEKFRPVLFQSFRQPLDTLEPIFDSTLEFVPPHWLKGPGQYVSETEVRLGTLALLRRMITRYPMITGALSYRRSRTFANDSVVAIGKDAVAWRQLTEHVSPSNTGLSSPKRYLWATTPVPSSWKYAMPLDDRRIMRLWPIRGDILLYITPDDSEEFLLQEGDDPVATDAPPDPTYPRRALSVFFLFEVLKSCHAYINSHQYRVQSRHPLRPRSLTHVVLTYPSALGPEEVRAYSTQARKAMKIFETLYGRRGETQRLRLHTRWDEGVASQLCYVASELRTDRSPMLTELLRNKEVVVASLDFGGGTLDAAVVRYSRGVHQGEVQCAVEFVEGEFIGGDDLTRLIIRELIFPQLAEFVADEKAFTSLLSLFHEGSVNKNTTLRIRLLRDVFIPLAHGILEATSLPHVARGLSAVDVCGDEVLDPLGEFLFGTEGRGRIRTWELLLDADEVMNQIKRCFETPVSTLLSRMPLLELTAIVLAGRLASLPGVGALVTQSLASTALKVPVLPFGKIEGIRETYRTMFGTAPIDSKVSVMLGAAIALTGAWGRAPSGLRFSVDYSAVAGPFFWGLVDARTLRFSDLLNGVFLSPSDDSSRVAQLSMGHGTYYIGRRSAKAGSDGVALVRYRLEVDKDGVIGLRRERNPETNEEILKVTAMDGPVGARLIPQSHLRHTYWLDSGLLSDNVEGSAGHSGVR